MVMALVGALARILLGQLDAIAVDMIEKHSMKGEAVPLGAYENQKYFWEKGDIVQSKTGPALVIPPFVIEAANADDKRHWGNIAEKDWGLAYK